MKRRDFLQFLGCAGLGLSLADNLLAAAERLPGSDLASLAPSLEDKFITLDGINYKILIRWGDKINPKQTFGFNNDFIAYHSLGPDHAIMMVNHEYANPLFIAGHERSKKNIDLERLEVGISLLEVKKVKGNWQVVNNSKYNRRVDATTEIPFAWPEQIKGSKTAIGTLANCAGGQTPWGTFLTCEENYDTFYGDLDRQGNPLGKSFVKWESVYPLPPEHYGWVVEVEPKTGKSKKLISLGRCAHECATLTKAKNGKVVAYTGDDANDEHLYKFISDSESSLEQGKLYVANLEKGEWISLDLKDSPILKKHFKNQTDIQIFVREAAKLVGGTPLDRPEDIEIDPLTGNVLIALTNNKPKKNFYGSILKIVEHNNDPGSLKFTYDTFLAGGKSTGFACPDNMVFDAVGNLWFTTDMSGKDVGKGAYQGLGNNALLVFIRSGEHQGKVIRVATGPVEAELTGPCFSPDYKTLFLAVQHPGEESPSLQELNSQWPDGGIPKSAVVTLEGPLLEKIVTGKL
jgi:uncharacterized protein